MVLFKHPSHDDLHKKSCKISRQPIPLPRISTRRYRASPLRRELALEKRETQTLQRTDTAVWYLEPLETRVFPKRVQHRSSAPPRKSVQPSSSDEQPPESAMRSTLYPANHSVVLLATTKPSPAPTNFTSTNATPVKASPTKPTFVPTRALTKPSAILYLAHEGSANVRSKPIFVSGCTKFASTSRVSLRASGKTGKTRSSVARALNVRPRQHTLRDTIVRKLKRSWGRDGKASEAKTLHNRPTPTIALGRGTPGACTTETLTKKGRYSPPIINSGMIKAGWPSRGNLPSDTLLLHRKAIETIVSSHKRGIKSMSTSSSHDFLKNMLEREEKAKREQGVTGGSETEQSA
ncbi:hypothetical protein C8Q74DRAFT_1437263 [Fomes fomentarius]|nr:hypothetical protein C8Q74DRAFT_1437263 [Fomes fomentarius]